MRTKKPSRQYNLKRLVGKPCAALSIRLIITIDGRRYPYYTGQMATTQDWDNKKQRVKNNGSVFNATVINKKLDALGTAFDKAIYHLQTTEQPVTRDTVVGLLDEYTGKKDPKTGEFWAFIERYIKDSENRINPATGLKISPDTIRKYNGCCKVFREFEVFDNRRMRFDNINVVWFERFNHWATIEKKYSVNTIDKVIGCLHVWMNEATRQGETKNEDYKQIRTKAQPTTAIYLTDEDIEKIYNVELTGKYDNARDLFLLGCYTGFRYGDTSRIQAEHINKKTKEITMYQAKTGDSVTIPIMHPNLLSILEKRNWSPPRSISNQKLNKHIKEVCRMAKINDKVEVQTTKAGVRSRKIVSKWKLVSSHTARRSFASNLYKEGVQPQSIMKLTGHKSQKCFMTYIRLSDAEHIAIVQKHIEQKYKSKSSPDTQ